MDQVDKNPYSLLLGTDNFEDRKLCICIFNRATFARCQTVIEECSRFATLDLTVLLSSSALWEEYGKPAQTYISKMKTHHKVRFELIDIEYPSQDHRGMCHASSQIVGKFADFFTENAFDAVLVVADRFETLPAAMAASYLNIPLIHLQGGEITNNIDDRVRHAVTMLSDFHLVCTSLAREYVSEMGQHEYRIFNTGCPSLDLVNKYSVKRFKAKEKYIISMFHPETENPELAYAQTCCVLESVIEHCAFFGLKCYWFYPNADPGREKIVNLLDEAIKANPHILIKAINKPPSDFLWQLAGAKLIVGNSSCGIRETSYMGTPSVNIGMRQGYRERAANVVDCDYDVEEIKEALKYQYLTNQKLKFYHRSNLYGDGGSGRRIAGILTRLKLKKKGTLDYIYKDKYREKHTGEERFKSHAVPRHNPEYRDKEKLDLPREERSDIFTEHKLPSSGDSRVTQVD